MQNLNVILLICSAVAMLVVLIAVLFGGLASKFFAKNILKKRDNDIYLAQETRQKYHQAIRDTGRVVAQAVVLTARVLNVQNGGRRDAPHYHTLEYEVEVFPDQKSAFRTKITDEFFGQNYQIIGTEMVSQHGQKFWVVFYPEDTTKIKIDHFGEVDNEARLNFRRIEFNKLMAANEELKKYGEQSEAIITRVDDLDLPYPKRNSRAMHLSFEVTSVAGDKFQAEGDSLMVETSLKKYSVGQTVFVRFDPQNPKRAVLDTERNKAL